MAQTPSIALSAAQEMKLCAVVGHTEHDGAYFAEVFLELAGFSVGIDIELRDEIQFIGQLNKAPDSPHEH